MRRRDELVSNLLRFGLVGGGVTLAGYAVFTGLLRMGAHYAAASAAATAAGVALSYGLNRGFTFSVTAKPSPREFAAYSGTYLLQYLLALTIYAVLIDGFGMAATPAFLTNLVVTAAFSFTVMRWAVFPWRGTRAASAVQAGAGEPRSP